MTEEDSLSASVGLGGLFLAPLFLLNYFWFIFFFFLQKTLGGGGQKPPPQSLPLRDPCWCNEVGEKNVNMILFLLITFLFLPCNWKIENNWRYCFLCYPRSQEALVLLTFFRHRRKTSSRNSLLFFLLLQGNYGLKRFLRDGYKTVMEDKNRRYYEQRELQVQHACLAISFKWKRLMCFEQC